MPEAAIIALAGSIKAIADMVTKIVEGQPIDVKAKMWEWYITDVTEWRKFWGLKP